MDTNQEEIERLQNFFDAFESYLRPEIRTIIEAVKDGLSSPEWSIEIPDPDAVDLTIHDLASTVARSANHYGRMARIAGMVKAQLKLSEAKYKRLYKISKIGKNEDERDRVATEASHLEHLNLSIVEAAVEVADALERSARIASESSRKIYDKILAQNVADQRSESVNI